MTASIRGSKDGAACRRRVRLAALASLSATFALAMATPAAAQPELLQWVDRELGKQSGRADLRYSLYPERAVRNQATDLEIDEYSVTYTVPIYQDEYDEWSTSGDIRYAHLATDAILPDTDQPLPNELWDILFSAGYRHRFGNDWVGGVSLAFGSASDEPFHSWDEMTLRALGLLLVPWREHDAWLFSLLYANDQEFLGGFPIPGIAYVYTPSDELKAVIGVPFSSIEYEPTEKLKLEAQYFPVREVRTRVTYALFRPLRLFAGFDWINDHYFLKDRPDEDDQLYYYEKRFRRHPLRPAPRRRAGARRLGVRPLLLRGQRVLGPRLQPDRRRLRSLHHRRPRPPVLRAGAWRRPSCRA